MPDWSLCGIIAAAGVVAAAGAQPAARQAPAAFGVCRPATERAGAGDIGCWILTDQPIGRLTSNQNFWHLDTFPSKADAERSRGPHGRVIETEGKTWLFTIEAEGWRPAARGIRVAKVGPLPIAGNAEYSAVYMDTVTTPGFLSAIHTHSGPEAWYTLEGESCLETPDGAIHARAGSAPVFVPGGPPMLLTSTGKSIRRALTLILHDSSKPPTTVIRDWTPKGLCKN